MHLRNWRTDRKYSILDAQVECASQAYGRRSLLGAWSGYVTHYKILGQIWGSNHITGTAEPKVVKFCTCVGLGYISYNNRMIYHQQRAWLWSRNCFKILSFVVMQRVARVCQRQLSYL